MKKILSLALVTLMVVSCKKDSSKVDQDKIFQEITCTYDAELNTTKVSIHFHEDNIDGKSLELSGDSKVTVNGTVADRSGSIYSLTLTGLVNNVPVVFTDIDGKTFTNSVNPESSISNDTDYYITKTAASSYYFGGNAVATGETVTVKFVNNADSDNSASISQTSVGAYHIALTSTNMSGINYGLATATTTRQSSISTGNFTSVGGIIKSSYSSTKSVKEIY